MADNRIDDDYKKSIAEMLKCCSLQFGLLIIILIFAALISALTGCSSARTIEKEVIVHDTLVQKGKDSIIYKTKTITKDSLITNYYTTIIKDTTGKILQTDNITYIYKSHNQSDSSYYWKEKYDSLYKANQTNNTETKEKKQSFFGKIKEYISNYIIETLILIMLGALIFKAIRKRK